MQRFVSWSVILLQLLLVGCSEDIPTAKKYSERWYQESWCGKQKGIVEYKLVDKTRIDCLTETFAIEVDFAKKWAEAIGQSLHYALMTDKAAGVLLIVESKDDERYLQRIRKVIAFHHLPITLWITSADELQPKKR